MGESRPEAMWVKEGSVRAAARIVVRRDSLISGMLGKETCGERLRKAMVKSLHIVLVVGVG